MYLNMKFEKYSKTICHGRIFKSKLFILLSFLVIHFYLIYSFIIIGINEKESLNKINLMTVYTKPILRDRQKEIDSILERNLKNPHINKIWLFIVEGEELPNHLLKSRFNRDKLNIIKLNSTPMYGDLFRYSQYNLKGQITIISNIDNYLDDTSKLLKDTSIDWSNRMFFVTRLDVDKKGKILDLEKCTRFYDSYDTFIFKSPLNDSAEFLGKLDRFKIGNEGIEFEILKELYNTNGIMGEDPCEFVRLYHYHHNDEEDEIIAHKAIEDTEIKTIYPLKISEFTPRMVVGMPQRLSKSFQFQRYPD